MKRISNSALSYWFPKIRDAGLPVPKTHMLRMGKETEEQIYLALRDLPFVKEWVDQFCLAIHGAATNVGYPAFLRTDHTSDKHSWKDSCFLRYHIYIRYHLFAIVEFSSMADMIGLPCDRWAVREYLPIKPLGHCPLYKDMPVCREYRFFVTGGRVDCWHPYWPKEAIIEGGLSEKEIDIEALHAEPPGKLFQLAESAGRAVGGSWSVDILDTEKGWYITDMAEAWESWHWPACPNSETPDDIQEKEIYPDSLIEKKQ